MIPPEPFEDVRRARDQYAKERDVLAEALAAVLNLADEWARRPLMTLTPEGAAEQLRAVVAAPVTAAPQSVTARLEAYGHLARLRAEIEAAQREAERLHEPIRPLHMGPTVAQAAREVANSYAIINAPIALGITQAFERFANLLEGK